MLNITQQVADSREALQVVNHNAYRHQLTRRIQGLRRQLGIATNKRERFSKELITASDIGKDQRYVHLLVLEAERAWAHAMHIKAFHSERIGSGLCAGRARQHSLSKFTRSKDIATSLLKLLNERDVTHATDDDILESYAYENLIAGDYYFEKIAGRDSAKGNDDDHFKCLETYSVARTIYNTLLRKGLNNKIKDVVADSIDPALLYAAHRSASTRMISVDAIAKKYFPVNDPTLRSLLGGMNETYVPDTSGRVREVEPRNEKHEHEHESDIPTSIMWRGLEANVLDASIGQAIASFRTATEILQRFLVQNPQSLSKERAAAYDPVLEAIQDAIDATRSALDQFERNGIEEDDPRMRDLRITHLSMHYDLVCCRIGRNRTLVGTHDGMYHEPVKRPGQSGNRSRAQIETRDPPDYRRNLSQLRDRMVLYDANMQSIRSVMEFRGAARDEGLIKELQEKIFYFRALKCLNIAYSLSSIGNYTQALGLLQRSRKLMESIPHEPLQKSATSFLGLDISKDNIHRLNDIIMTSAGRVTALAELERAGSGAVVDHTIYRGEHLSKPEMLAGGKMAFHPNQGRSLFVFPPPLVAVPVKPVLLDIAWNYVRYPSQASAEERGTQQVSEAIDLVTDTTELKGLEKKRGWFGFGR